MQMMLYQECRPESINDYVFVDKDMETKLKEWIGKSYLPNLIFSGPPGTGKCLGGDELIEVQIDSNQLTSEQLELLSHYLA